MDDPKFMRELCDYFGDVKYLAERMQRQVACKDIIDKYCPAKYSEVMRFFPSSDTVEGVLMYLRPEAEAGVPGVQQAVDEIEQLFLMREDK